MHANVTGSEKAETCRKIRRAVAQGASRHGSCTTHAKAAGRKVQCGPVSGVFGSAVHTRKRSDVAQLQSWAQAHMLGGDQASILHGKRPAAQRAGRFPAMDMGPRPPAHIVTCMSLSGPSPPPSCVLLVFWF